MKLLFFVIASLILPNLAHSQPRDENGWTTYLASQYRDTRKWEEQYRTPDGSYIDIVSPEIAYEVEWAPKHHEAVGQALFYSAVTGKRPGIILLIKDPAKEQKYYLRTLVVAHKFNIKVITVDTRFYPPREN